jgi:predicted nucleic acid-binding protein
VRTSSFHARRVFIDSSAYFGLANPHDAEHQRLVAGARRLAAERRQMFTSNFVLAETHALTLQRLGRAIAYRVLVELDNSNTILVRVSAADERRAREILAQYQDKDFSLTDATSFAIMEGLRIGQALTLDHHFAQYGFAVQPDR